MPTDTIRRLVDRLDGHRESLVERAARRMTDDRAGEAPVGADRLNGGVPPVQAAVDIQAGPQPMPVQAEEGLPTGRRVSLDMRRLEAAGLITAARTGSRVAEEFRVIKRPLIQKALARDADKTGKSSVIMVTSAVQSEGKSFVAANLAISMALERELSVLLIDADSARPALPGLLGIDAERGLIDLLQDDGLTLDDVVVHTDLADLRVLTCGRPHPHAAELLAGRRMHALVDRLASGPPGTITIIDAAPVLASSEPGALAAHTGQIVMVIEAERTGRRVVEEALTVLDADAEVGLVLNKMRSWLGDDRFGSAYDAYHDTGRQAGRRSRFFGRRPDGRG